jgi:hypothetical protein
VASSWTPQVCSELLGDRIRLAEDVPPPARYRSVVVDAAGVPTARGKGRDPGTALVVRATSKPINPLDALAAVRAGVRGAVAGTLVAISAAAIRAAGPAPVTDVGSSVADGPAHPIILIVADASRASVDDTASVDAALAAEAPILRPLAASHDNDDSHARPRAHVPR